MTESLPDADAQAEPSRRAELPGKWSGDAGNGGGVHVTDVPADGFNYSAELVLPPISTVIFKWVGE